MGYYTRIHNKNVKIKKEFIDKIKNDIEICKQYSSDIIYSSESGEPESFNILRKKLNLKGNYIFYHIETINIEKDCYFYWDDEMKLYDEKELISYLADKVTKGDIYMTGEDGEKWGYRFDGEGNFKKLKVVWVVE